MDALIDNVLKLILTGCVPALVALLWRRNTRLIVVETKLEILIHPREEG